MSEDTYNQYSYLLRIWKDSSDGEWRASLKDLITMENHHFANLEAVFAHLCQTARRPVWRVPESVSGARKLEE
jgi:rubrerythrin